MKFLNENIQIILAPSILGLRPSGVEKLGESLLKTGLAAYLHTQHPVIEVPTLNTLYNSKRDEVTGCLNAGPIRTFSKSLAKAVSSTINNRRFPFILGGDCSILIGIMTALKAKETYGLIFFDAHADFYEPEKSITGEVADMDLAIVTGRGPEVLTNIDNLQPYVKDKNVVHIGQRDWKETKKYGSQDIRETAIKCFSLADIETHGTNFILKEIIAHIDQIEAEGFWIHFDTDVLSDEINPAVDYRLPNGLTYEQMEYFIKNLLLTEKISGMSVTIFNPILDRDGQIAKAIAKSLGWAFDVYGTILNMQ